MNFLAQIPLEADGNVRPMRLLTTVSGNGNGQLAVEATASTQILIGVSERWTRNPPGSASDDGFIAIDGEKLPYRGPGQRARLILGNTVSNVGVLLTSDSAGRGIPQAPSNGTTCYYGAMALETGLVNENVDVLVLFPTPTV
jgi:hypothetical protein